jgi:glycine/D-amino acid oxidase-like deaminating enzyme/nitrite reductase/ring-hydroxylating ferredoxin subunit
MTTRSLWRETARPPERAPLGSDARADVCVVGAGIAGLTTAYMLACEGQSVVVLDDGPIGGGQTMQTSAHLSNALDRRYAEVERIRGVDATRLAASSHSAAIDRIEAIVAEERIACGFERLDGYLFAAPNQPRDVIEEEADAARRAGLAVEWLPEGPLAPGPSLRFPCQAQFHPLAYLSGLAEALERRGGTICTGTHVAQVEGGGQARVTTDRGRTVTASSVVVATNTPVNDRVALHTKQAAYITYVIAAQIMPTAVPRALYWDTAHPYHYVRLAAAHTTELLVVGGEDHRSGQASDTTERWARLEDWARRHFPMLGVVEFRWSGQVMESLDGLAFIGPNPLDEPNVFVASGDSGMGLTHGTIAGMLLTDLIQRRANPWTGLYDPARVPFRATPHLLKENLSTASQYVEWLTPGDVAVPTDVAPGTGAVMRYGAGKAALYCDEDGVLHARSAVCPHLGCLVAWNAAARTWDCPCHGSRFDCKGHVINGPANRDLTPLEEEGKPLEAAPQDV